MKVDHFVEQELLKQVYFYYLFIFLKFETSQENGSLSNSIMQPSDLLKPCTFLLPTCFLYLKGAFSALSSLDGDNWESSLISSSLPNLCFIIFRLVLHSKTEHLNHKNTLLVTRCSCMSDCSGVQAVQFVVIPVPG